MVQPTSVTAPTSLTLQLFGAFQAERGEVPLTGLHVREGERLLAYLVLHANQPVPSKDLAQRFWPFEAQVNSSGRGEYPSVRQALYTLRQALGPDAEKLTRPYRTAVQLDLTGIEVDIYRFDRLATIQEEAAWPAAYAEAVSLYKGLLLTSWNEPWLTGPRKKYQRTYEIMLRRLIQHAADEQQPDAVARWARLLLEASSEGEQVHRDFIRPYTESGQSGRQTMPEPSVAIANAVEEAEEAEELSLDAAGGAVPLTSNFYIERQVDALCQKALRRRDGVVLLKGARQVGKTSLLARVLQLSRQNGVRVVVTDFQKINAADFATPDTLYRSLAVSLTLQLNLSTSPQEVWDEDFSPNMNFEQFLCQQVLGSLDQPLVWAMDEVDRLLTCPFGSEVFGLFRSWYNERSLNPDSALARLSLVIAYATEAHLFITDLNQSPFNVGTRLGLTDFTPQEVAELNQRYRSPIGAQELSLLYENLSGQPYLTRRALDQVVSGVPLADIFARASNVNGIFGDHLRRLWLSVAKSTELLEALRAMLTGTGELAPDDFYRLQAAGILTGDTPEEATFRCRLYEVYFARQLS